MNNDIGNSMKTKLHKKTLCLCASPPLCLCACVVTLYEKNVQRCPVTEHCLCHWKYGSKCHFSHTDTSLYKLSDSCGFWHSGTYESYGFNADKPYFCTLNQRIWPFLF